MVQSLEEYVSQAARAYQPATDALQNQLGSLDSKLANTNEQINRSYQQQQADLNRSRNMAAESASLQAAGSGGSFGGSANLANRRYYDKTFVPAVTQLKTNQANDLASARQANDDLRNNINSQLANIQAEYNRSALAQYYADLEAEREREFQAQQAAANRAAQRASSPWSYMDNGYGNNGDSGVKTWDFGNGYRVYDDGGEAVYSRNGTQISRGEFLSNANVGNWDLWNDIWGSGTKTNGVGSDTIDLYNKLGNNTYLKNALRNDQRTSYLY